MSDEEAWMSHLRAAAAARGAAWIQDQVQRIVGEERRVAGEPGRTRARRSRPPERFSPSSSPPAQRRFGSPLRADPPGRPAQHLSAEAGGSSGRNPLLGRSSFGRGRDRSRSPPPSGRRGNRRDTVAYPAESQHGEAAQRGRMPPASAGQSGGAAGGSTVRLRRVARSSGQPGASEGRAAASPRASRKRLRTGDGSWPSGTVSQASGRPGPSGSSGRGPEDPWSMVEVQSERERSSSEEGEVRPRSPAMEAGSAAAGSLPVQPGECALQNIVNLQSSLCGLLGVTTGGGAAAVATPPTPHAAGAVPAASGADADWWALLGGLRSLVQKLEGLAPAASNPSFAWVQPRAPCPTAPAAAAIGQVGVVTGQESALVRTTDTAEAGKDAEVGRLPDSARGELYVCFEGPLGAHLRQEAKEKIWRGEYVEIFTLLPLEKFNLDRVRYEESRREDEEKRRFRFIPRTFNNWLQAFAIFASVLGEKQPECCSALFCYLDAISEAHRVYGGSGWLRYDEQFRQRKAVRPILRWDHKDISLWMKLMSPARPGSSFFQGGGGGSGAPGQSATKRKGFCWQFNEGSCRFGLGCRFRHECSGCSGSHPYSKCPKQGKGRHGDAPGKRDDASEGGRDASFPK